ncbi:MAG TPA: TRAP transporter small permease [Spirochaetota bacterium]
MTEKINNGAGRAFEILFEKVVLYLDRFLLGIGGVSVTLIMLLATANVVMRLFSTPLRGVYEVIAYTGAISVATALGYAQRRKDHIVVDIISEKYNETVRRIVDIVSFLIMTVFFGLVTKVLFTWGMILSSSGEVSETLKIAYHPFVLCVSVGFGVLTATCLADAVHTTYILIRKVRS